MTSDVFAAMMRLICIIVGTFMLTQALDWHLAVGIGLLVAGGVE